MRNKVFLAVALTACMAAPAFAAIQNVKVSGDIDSTYLNRNDFNLGNRTAAGAANGLTEQSVFFTQTRLRVEADLSDNVSTTVGLINERAWNSEGSSDTNVNLYLAYATMREFLYSPLTVSVGRQVFAYGNGLILGDGGPNNGSSGNFTGIANDFTKRTAYDGVKAILDYKPLTLDLLYFKNNQTTLTGVQNAVKTSSDVYGVNANYQLGDAMNTVVEGYLFSRISGDLNTSVTGGAANKGDQLYVPGLRLSTNPVKGLNVQGEVAWQAGRKGFAVGSTTTGGDNLRREAMAYQFMGSYTLPMEEKYKPTVSASYSRFSGDKNATDTRSTTVNQASRQVYAAWDPFNEAQGGGTIYNSLLNLTNMNIVSAGLSLTPLEDVTTAFTWSGLWADKRYDSSKNPLSSATSSFLQPDGTSVTPTTTTRKDIGNEYDVNVNYAYTEDVTFGVSLGWFVPGKAFSGVNDSTASQAVAHVLVNF